MALRSEDINLCLNEKRTLSKLEVYCIQERFYNAKKNNGKSSEGEYATKFDHKGKQR